MRPSAPPWPAGDARRAVRNEQPEHNRRSALQPRLAIPPPPRVPHELVPHLHTDTVPAPSCGQSEDGTWIHVLACPAWDSDEACPTPVSETEPDVLDRRHPEMSVIADIDEDPDVPDFDAQRVGMGVISRELHERRVTELLDSGNRLLQETRDERAAHARTRWQLECATTQGLTLRAALHRIDPAWRST